MISKMSVFNLPNMIFQNISIMLIEFTTVKIPMTFHFGYNFLLSKFLNKFTYSESLLKFSKSCMANKIIFAHNFMSLLPLIGIPIFLYKIFSKNKEFSSVLFVIFGILAYLFFTIQNILLSFILWELISWTSYVLLKKKNNLKDVKIIFLSNIVGGLSFAWATCILVQKCNFWHELQFVSFSNSEIFQIAITLSITILTKSSQFPFSWLKFTKKSSSLISAYLHSATVVQMGLYLLLQIKNPILKNNFIYNNNFQDNHIFLCNNTLLWSNILFYITLLQSALQFRINDLKKLTALTSQMHTSACLLAILYNAKFLPYILFAHAIYKSVMFILCDEITNKSYEIDKISQISISQIILITLCSIPMCGIPFFLITNIYGNFDLLSSIILKSSGIVLFYKLFRQILILAKQNKITFSIKVRNILFLPCFIFLIPKINSFKFFFILILFAYLISNIDKFFFKPILNKIKSNYNIIQSLQSIFKNISIPNKVRNINISIVLMIILIGSINIYKTYFSNITNNDFTNNLTTKYNLINCLILNQNQIIFNTILIIGCIFLLFNSSLKKLSGLIIVSIFMTNQYIKFGGEDIVVTGIIVDIITIYLMIKSKKFHFNDSINPETNNNLTHPKLNYKLLIFSFLIACFLIACFTFSTQIIQYSTQTSVNDIVVFYRLFDTLGETLTLLAVAIFISKV